VCTEMDNYATVQCSSFLYVVVVLDRCDLMAACCCFVRIAYKFVKLGCQWYLFK